jgi:hypothetical protein
LVRNGHRSNALLVNAIHGLEKERGIPCEGEYVGEL